MGLRKLNLKYQYRQDEDNLLDDFYSPCLANSKLYRRAVGYFTSGSLALAARGLCHFIEETKGYMQLIASPKLTPEDQNAIRLGYEAREDVVARSLLRQLQPTENDIIRKRLGFLAWMIANGRLDIKIAFVRDLSKNGIYHEKIGMFVDEQEDKVAFSGSSNETESGLYSNFEVLEVYCSWREGDRIRVENKERDFKRLWDNETAHLDVLEFPEAAKKGFRIYEPYYRRGDKDPERVSESSPIWILQKVSMPVRLSLRDYQSEAIRAWVKNNGSGILEMATGTGKTVTALTAAVKVIEKLGRLGLFIVAPYNHLVDQWEEEAKKFGFDPILAYKSSHQWVSKLVSTLTAFKIRSIPRFCVITTTATFAGNTMQRIVRQATNPAMLIADEAHHFGARKLRTCLPENIKYRMGLSATPERWFDDEGTAVIKSYFQPGIVFTYGLKEAIDAGYLTPYYYYPHLVELTPEESDEYLELTKRIARVIAANGKLDLDDQRVQSLLIARARVLNRAENKLTLLKELLEARKDTYFNLFYCADSKVGGQRQIDLVTRMLGKELGMKVHPFTSEETTDERRFLLNEFENGRLQGLVAIRCLDEGVDVPATQTAYILASSTNPREFIQRRGRILRLHTSKKMANIHDFIVYPRSITEICYLEPEVFNIERKIVKRELARVSEFADLAINGASANLELERLKKAYNLLDL